MTEYLIVGKVLKPQGIKGELKVMPMIDDVSRYGELKSIWLRENDTYRSIALEGVRYMGDNVILKLEGCHDRSTAEGFRDEDIWIPRSIMGSLPEDTYLVTDIIGCIVYTDTGKLLGPIRDIIYTGSNDVYIIESQRGEVLIPALKEVIKDVDIEDKVMTIDTTEIEGLIPDEI